MIRELERGTDHLGLSPLASRQGRIPIFALSASLLESQKDTYVDAGFDGWILKPVDYARLATLLSGMRDDSIRDGNLYKPGEWERGGWFNKRGD